MKTILITGIGGDIAQSTASIIRKRYSDYQLIGTDTHSQHGGSLFVDKLYNLPFANTPEYFPLLEELLRSETIDVVFPMTEPELSVLGPLIAEHTQIQWVTAGQKVINAGIDKLATMQVLNALGIATPWTIPVTEGMPLSYPCILKRRFGSGSRAVFVVKAEAEAIYLAERHPDAIYQQLLEPADQEVTCAVYRTLDGEVITLQMLRRLVGGFTGWAKVINNPDISKMCEQIATGLDLRGSMNVQLRLTEEGPRVFEINPRISSTVLMRDRIGFSDPIWALDEIAGKKIELPVFKHGQIMVRTQGAAILDC